MANSTPVRKACLQCGKEFMARYQWSQKRHQRFCSLRCHKLTTKYTKEQVIAAFWNLHRQERRKRLLALDRRDLLLRLRGLPVARRQEARR
jgi:hypothetical protein